MPGTGEFERVRAAAEGLRSVFGEAAAVAVVLGSGLGAFSESLGDGRSIPYGALPAFPNVSVPGHSGHVTVGTAGGTRVAAFAGRIHLYEGYTAHDVVRVVRAACRWGVGTVLLTNAAGGIRDDLAPGTLMMVADHLNLTGDNPCAGGGPATLGPRFVDLTEAYTISVRDAARIASQRAGGRLPEGVYAGLRGSSYETPAEIRMLRALGADAVGMSTVLEVIAARQAHARAGAVSCITNRAAGLSSGPLSHEEVEAVARATRDRLVAFLGAWVEEVAR